MNKTRKIGVVLVTPYQTGANTYTDVFRTVEIEIPNDGNDWHVAGEAYNITEEQKVWEQVKGWKDEQMRI